MIKEPKRTVSVLMPLELYRQLKTLADDTSRTLPAYIRLVLKDYLWHLENSPEMLADWRTVRGGRGRD